MKVIIIGYEPTQAEILKEKAAQLALDGHEAVIVAFDQELEWLLADSGTSFVSSLKYRNGNRLKNLELSEKLVNDTRSLVFSGLDYRGVALESLFCFSLQIYMEKWLYFSEMYGEILERERPDKVYACSPFFSPSIQRDTYLYYENEAPVICLKSLCQEQNIIFERMGKSTMHSLPKDSGKRSTTLVFGLKILNAFMGLMQRRNDIRLLASEYWKHIGPLFTELPSSSLTLYDRSEFKQIPFLQILRHRMRFMHGPEDLSSEALKRVSESEERIRTVWKSRRDDLLGARWMCGPVNMSTVIAEVLDNVIAHQLRGVLVEAEQIFDLLEKTKPQAVILRASVSAQPHFPILAQAARSLGVPSIELQHGLEIFAQGSISRFHSAEYIGLYGEIIRQEMSRHTPEGPKLSVIGSPYFDSSCLISEKSSVHDESKHILCIAPDVSLNAVFDTYDAFEYFSAVALSAQSSGAHVRIKLRGSRRQPFYLGAIRRAFKGTDYSIIQKGSIAEAGRNARLAISCYSTAILELLQCGIPTTIAAVSPLESHFVSFHFDVYEKAGALKIVRDKSELIKIVAMISGQEKVRESLKQSADDFMSRNYAFDGLAAKRLADLIRKVTGFNSK